ncbi:hypothetical protein CLONEX_00749 [[Clostridium] nexile DSM 1787]|nr:hypothetical protein CLONEX_00749 [[Clostridium] nexile DSM 1787]
MSCKQKWEFCARILFLIMILPEKAVRSEKMVKIQCDYIP